MTLDLFTRNFLAMVLQATVVGSIGALLPVLLRVRAPRPLLYYWHGLLGAILLLPSLQFPHLTFARERWIGAAAEVYGRGRCQFQRRLHGPNGCGGHLRGRAYPACMVGLRHRGFAPILEEIGADCDRLHNGNCYLARCGRAG